MTVQTEMLLRSLEPLRQTVFSIACVMKMAMVMVHQTVSGAIVSGTDCDDQDGTIHPSAPELCDGQINTCIGSLLSDEIDNDGDGYVECSWDSNGWDGTWER